MVTEKRKLKFPKNVFHVISAQCSHTIDEQYFFPSFWELEDSFEVLYSLLGTSGAD